MPYFDLLNHASRTRNEGESDSTSAAPPCSSSSSSSDDDWYRHYFGGGGGGGGEPFVNCVQSFDASDMSFRVTALSDIASGEECFINYGDLPNGRLLPLYGFCLPDNPYDALPLALPNLSSLPAPPKASAGGTARGAGGAAIPVKNNNDLLLEPRDLVATLREPLPAKLVDFAESAFATSQLQGADHSDGGSDGGATRRRGLRWLAEGLRQQAEAYGTSLEDDLSELRRAVTTTTTTTTTNSPSSDGDGEREGPTPGWKLSCLVARVGEKRILDKAIQQAEREAAR